MSIWSRIWTGMQCRHFCPKTYRWHIQSFKKQIENFVRKWPKVCLVKNLDQNAMWPFLHKKFQVSYIEVQETNRKFFRNKKIKKKKNHRVNFLRKCPMSVQLRVLTGMQCCCFCAKTCRYHMRSKKQIKNSLETKMK